VKSIWVLTGARREQVPEPKLEHWMYKEVRRACETHSNRAEISNPGEPIVPVERLIDGYQSRNERFADLMRRMHICEEKVAGLTVWFT
jgi:Putative ATP-dependent DNA helicase recG C-terminal